MVIWNGANRQQQFILVKKTCIFLSLVGLVWQATPKRHAPNRQPTRLILFSNRHSWILLTHQQHSTCWGEHCSGKSDKETNIAIFSVSLGKCWFRRYMKKAPLKSVAMHLIFTGATHVPLSTKDSDICWYQIPITALVLFLMENSHILNIWKRCLDKI